MDAAGTIGRGDLLVRDGRIAAIGDAVPAAVEALPGGRPEESFDASGCFVLPGFVQAHLHLCQTLFRGLAEQADLLRWLRESIWPLEAAHTAASMAASVRLGLVELLAAGVTTVNDMGTVGHADALGAALEESGIRAVFGKALMDRGDGVPTSLLEGTDDALAGALAVADRWHGAGAGRLRVSLAPRFVLSCSDELWRNVVEASAARDLVIHTHVAESPAEGREVKAAVSRTATRYFAEREVLGPRFVGAHGVWLDDEERSLVAGAGAALVHCPGSNLKLGSGFARVADWRRAGIRCGLGSDGAACDNRLDPFHEMSLASGISRALDPADPLTPHEVLAMATRDGAAALGLGGETGTLEVGRAADVIAIDHTAPHVAPNETNDVHATIVHAARAGDVRLTMVAGRVLYREGAWATLDAERVAAEARAEARGLARRAETGERR